MVRYPRVGRIWVRALRAVVAERKRREPRFELESDASGNLTVRRKSTATLLASKA